MLSFSSALSPQRTFAGSWHRPVARLLLTLGLATVGFPSLLAYSFEAPVSPESVQSPSMLSVAQASNASVGGATASDAQSLRDGVYLFGQATQPEQLGSAYMVFEVNGNQVVGAFYMPQSSFDCFFGQQQADRLALTVIDSYEQSLHPYSVALASDSTVAEAGNPAIAPLGLQGFHRLENVSENDQRILSTCQADHQQRV